MVEDKDDSLIMSSRQLSKTHNLVMRNMVDEEEEEVDWSDLPYHMVELIMNKLMTADDYIRCSAVCNSWRTIFIDHLPHDRVHVTLPPPVLIVPTPKENNKKKKTKENKKKKKKKKKGKKKKTKSFSLYSIISKRVINQFQVTIPKNRYFLGSSHGWLVAVDNYCQILLFNPFLSPSAEACSSRSSSSSSSSVNNNKYEILLPSLKHIPDDDPDQNPYIPEECYLCTDHDLSPPSSNHVYLKKIILSADPLSDPINYIVMAIFGPFRELAYCRPGYHDKTWTYIQDDEFYPHYYMRDFQDVIYNKSYFYAVHLHGPVVVFNPAQNMRVIILDPGVSFSRLIDDADIDSVYLVEFEGGLLQIFRMLEDGGDTDDIVTDRRQPNSTISFQVYQVAGMNQRKFDIAKRSWMVNLKLMKNLRGHTLFLGDNESIYIRASDYPGCKPNSIYFTDDLVSMYNSTPWNGPQDLGIFNLEDDTIENHYPTDHSTPVWPVPIWIQPNITCITGENRFESNPV